MEPWADILRWYIEMGVDEAIAETPGEAAAAGASPAPRAAPAPSGEPPPPRRPAPAPLRPAPAAPSTPASGEAAALAAAAADLAALEAAVRGFTGCTLRETATNTVFADGDPAGPLMVIGEAPGAEEDRLGKPFVGRSGQLLDRMLATIGLDRRRNVYITNVLFWRPPGNRKPTPVEIAACLPFVWRHIALVAPRVLMLSGGTAAATLLDTGEGITRLRGRWRELAVPGLQDPVPTISLYHPSYLLRSPERKKETWHDLLAIQSKLEEIAQVTGTT
jgi:DNA polymerase